MNLYGELRCVPPAHPLHLGFLWWYDSLLLYLDCNIHQRFLKSVLVAAFRVSLPDCGYWNHGPWSTVWCAGCYLCMAAVICMWQIRVNEIEKAVCDSHRMICLPTSSFYISYVRTVIQYCEAWHFLCVFCLSISLWASLLIFFLVLSLVADLDEWWKIESGLALEKFELWVDTFHFIIKKYIFFTLSGSWRLLRWYQSPKLVSVDPVDSRWPYAGGPFH